MAKILSGARYQLLGEIEKLLARSGHTPTSIRLKPGGTAGPSSADSASMTP